MLQRPPTERERIAGEIADRLDGPMTALGVIFLLVVLAETITPAGSPVTGPLTALGWALWAVFVFEFLVRLVVAPNTWRFLKRNWWQIVFLALPFLRFLRIISRLRVTQFGRAGRVISAAVRGTRTAIRSLSARAAWLSAVTVIVVLAASLLLYQFGAYDSYPRALHDAAMSTIGGEPLPSEHPAAQILDIVLAVYSVIVFATLAGILGAFFFERSAERGEPGTPRAG